MNLWQLPKQATIGGKTYGIYADFRDVLQIVGYLDDPALPVWLRWKIALRLFYDGPIPYEYQKEAMDYLEEFLCCGRQGAQSTKRLDWKLDSDLILSDVNKVACCEIRELPFVHWWTFLAWFHGIGDGQLCTLVSIRDKLRRGKKLEGWEKDYFRQNKDRVLLRPALSPGEQAQKQALEEILRRRV